MISFRFGAAASCELPIDDCTLLSAASDEHPPLADPAAAVRAALAAPHDFPPLAAATAPGDRVAIALGDGMPQASSVLRGAIEALLNAGVSPAMATIVSASSIEDRQSLEKELASLGAAGVTFEVHAPDDEQATAMVGVNSSGEPLRLNRTLVEADFVLPVAAQRMPSGAAGDRSGFAGLFPQFSNRETMMRVRKDSISESAKVRKHCRAEIDEAGWLLGVQMVVLVVPGPGGGVAAVLAGEPTETACNAAQRMRAIWERPVDEQADLAIAAVAGDQREQTWESLAQAATVAGRLLAPGGVIALCSELETLPTGPLNRLREAVDFGDVQRKLARDDAASASAALALAKALEAGPVYLRSRLPDDVVESLGMTPFASDDELARLAAGRGHCVVIEEAQRIVPQFLGNEARR